jgi:hypothetical protein
MDKQATTIHRVSKRMHESRRFSVETHVSKLLRKRFSILRLLIIPDDEQLHLSHLSSGDQPRQHSPILKVVGTLLQDCCCWCCCSLFVFLSLSASWCGNVRSVIGVVDLSFFPPPYDSATRSRSDSKNMVHQYTTYIRTCRMPIKKKA